MCARLTTSVTRPEIANLFGLAGYAIAPETAPDARYNVAPSAILSVARVTNGVRERADLRWS
ncbi:unnamed protein product [Gemmata massiliana]|uniref:SOS response-associated peptidase n=1 Tax=Gemmata massiliana TaxID=1210884 RepID=A0A6P2DD91_9BACT|nr:hypothetical protein [Gemmata massiliana]VTR98876.1 unnamed protein product [Gemmata massiliana]